MSDSPTTNHTPPVRFVASEATAFIPADQRESIQCRRSLSSSRAKTRERSSSSSSSASTLSSRSNSLPSCYGVRYDDNDEDASSVDDASEGLAQLRERMHTLQRLLPRDSLSLLDEQTIPVLANAECSICLEESLIRPLSCCSSSVCSPCMHSHLSTHINEGQIRIACPSCPHIFTREQILSLLSQKDETGELGERYKRFYADVNREPHIKTCPQCCAIKEIDKSLFEGIRWKKNIPRHVVCDQCQFNWCFYCHAPWHERMTCKEYREGEKMLRAWASKTDNNQQNAQQCPRCKVFISRSGGCPHMICSKCHCDFCYNCGKRRYGLKFLGSHESRLSPFGCKYNFYPDKPAVRYTVRGLVAGAATLAAPVAAVGAVALLAVGTTIAAPTYGTYRLVQHIRKKRRARRTLGQLATSSTISVESSTNNDDSIDDDAVRRAIQASLETYEEEQMKQGVTKVDLTDSDHDSFDE